MTAETGRRLRILLLGLGIVCVAASMRSPVTSLGAVLPDLRGDLSLHPAVAGILTSLPPLVFGVAGAAVPRLVSRLPTGRAVTIAAAVIAVGTGVRGIGTTLWLLVGTVVAMIGIAVANVLLPVVVRSAFRSREGWVTGSYVAVMQVGASAGAALAVPVAAAAGAWEVGLAVWALPAAAGVVVWMLSSGRVSVQSRRDAGTSELTWTVLFRNRTAVSLMLVFGLQSTVAYVMMGWLPTILRDAGLSPATSGGMVAVAVAVSIPASFLLPGWLSGRPDQRSFVWWIIGPWAVGFVGLIVAPAAAPVLWACCVGFGFASFPVALMLMGLRSATTADTRQVSAFAQGIGYLVALPAPLFFGVLHDVTGGWTVPLAILLLLLWPLTVFGRNAGRQVHISPAPQQPVVPVA